MSSLHTMGSNKPHQGLQVTSGLKNVITCVVEVLEVGPCLDEPVGLHNEERDDEKAASPVR